MPTDPQTPAKPYCCLCHKHRKVNAKGRFGPHGKPERCKGSGHSPGFTVLLFRHQANQMGVELLAEVLGFAEGGMVGKSPTVPAELAAVVRENHDD